VTEFRRISDSFSASPQITEAQVAEARERGFRLIVNNRPEHEAEDQTPGPVIEQACRTHGLDYLAIPITHAGFSEAQIAALADALEASDGPVLGYCRSGTRSTFLWALSQARLGAGPDDIAAQASSAGYDVAPIRPLLDMLAARSNSSTA